MFRLVSSSDEESFNTNAYYLSDNLRALPNTPFAAMIATQQANYAIASNQDRRSTNTYGIGVAGKDSVKQVNIALIQKIK